MIELFWLELSIALPQHVTSPFLRPEFKGKTHGQIPQKIHILGKQQIFITFFRCPKMPPHPLIAPPAPLGLPSFPDSPPFYPSHLCFDCWPHLSIKSLTGQQAPVE